MRGLGVRSGRRVIQRFQKALEHHTDTPLGRLALAWFHRYFEASRNSAAAATLYIFISVLPACLAALALFDAAGGSANTFAEHLIDHLHLHGSSADVVRDAFGTASQNVLAASAAAVVSFLIWGVGIGKIIQEVCARAWRIELDASPADQVRFAIWFAVTSGLLTVEVIVAEEFRAAGWFVALPAWLVGMTAFWLWTPWYLLRRSPDVLPLVPGALLAAVVLGGATVVSPLTLGSWMNVNASYFGAFGVVLALLMWALVLIALAVTCVVFSPVYGEWRHGDSEQ